MAIGVVKALGVVSVIHLVLGILSIIIGVFSAQISPYPYHGMFYMGVWMGVWIVASGFLGISNAKEPGNYCRIGSFLGFCLVSLISIFVCVVVLGASVIKHYMLESEVDRYYYQDYLHDDHDKFYQSDAYFKKRNQDGIRGLAVYSLLIAVLSLDFLNCVVSCFVSRALWKKEEGESRQQYQLQRQQNRLQQQPFQQIIGQSPLQQTLLNFGQVQHSFPYIMADGTSQSYQMPKLPSYLDACPERIQESAIVRDQCEPNVPDEPPPAYTSTADLAQNALMEIQPSAEEVINDDTNGISRDEGSLREGCLQNTPGELADNEVVASVIMVEPAADSERNNAAIGDETKFPEPTPDQEIELQPMF